jgi:sialate O-acetylesterase
MPIGRTLLVAALLAALIRSAPAEELRLPSVISDHMVLQRDVPVRIWGRAVPGADVEVAFAQERASGRADAFGRWTVSLGALPASAVPRTLTVRSGDRTIRVNDVLVGEVWLCSGQSNMVWTVSGSARADEFIAAADEPRIRMFTVPNVAAHEPQEDCPYDWRVAGPETVGRFSAVAYHFARRLVAE